MNASSHERGHKGRRGRDHDNDPRPIYLGLKIWSLAEMHKLGMM